jgi:hypothetical protein
MMEEWAPVDEFPNYAVSSYGTVIRERSERPLTRSLVQNGMPTVGMMFEGRQFRRSVSGLVARAFLRPPLRDDFDTPINLDGDVLNCRADNLEWRPRWFAVRFRRQMQDRYYDSGNRDIRLLETGEVFGSIKEAAARYGILPSDIFKSMHQSSGWPTFPYRYEFRYAD